LVRNLLPESSFVQMVHILHDCRGKVVVTGMGKAGHIARKVAATLSSLGTSSFFLHPAEALHGDLGMIRQEDVVLAFSYSGESEEVTRLIPNIKKIDASLVAITGNADSTLARMSDHFYVFPNFEEACPMKLAPTSSTTAALVLGDALAICCAKQRGFNETNYAMFHPAGALGKRLILTSGDLMHGALEGASVRTGTLLKDAIVEMSSKSLGVVAVVTHDNDLAGLVTDGDLRRAFARGADIHALAVDEVMTKSPSCITVATPAIEALRQMTELSITSQVVLHENRKFAGIIKMSDVIKAGLVL
jgi:arabinose-5-phosphate isomerase